MHKLFFPITLALAVACGTSPLFAQSASDNATLVRTIVTVEGHDKNSTPPVINREDVMVYEGKDRDAVTEWIPAQGDNAALELFIVLDDGSNLTLGTQLDDLRKFILAQPPSAKIGVAYMQNGMARIQQNLTSDHEQAAKALRLPLGTAGVNGSPYFAISDLVKHWPGGANAPRREVVVATDGIDRYYEENNFDDPYLNQAIVDAQRAGIVICGIYTPGAGHAGHSYWQSYWGQLYLAQLAEKTGGEGYYIGFTGPPVSFSPYLDDVAHRLNNQYLLTFRAQPEKKAGMRKIRVTTEVNKADLVAPSAVYVGEGR